MLVKQRDCFQRILKLKYPNIIENYNLSQNTTFETNALIEKLQILLEIKDFTKIESTISKIVSLI